MAISRSEWSRLVKSPRVQWALCGVPVAVEPVGTSSRQRPSRRWRCSSAGPCARPFESFGARIPAAQIGPSEAPFFPTRSPVQGGTLTAADQGDSRRLPISPFSGRSAIDRLGRSIQYVAADRRHSRPRNVLSRAPPVSAVPRRHYYRHRLYSPGTPLLAFISPVIHKRSRN